MRWLTLLALTIGLAVPGVADPFRPSIKQQIELGQDAAKQIRKEEKVLGDNDPRVKELRRLGELAVAQIPEKERKDKPFVYTFDVIDSKEINAFALPGGPIFFYTGLLDEMDTEDEVMAVLGHELTHIRNQHWASQYADNLKRKLGLIVVFSLLGANSDILNAADMLDDILVGLKYSRRHESEADTVGYDVLTGAGYNPQGIVDMFQVLKAAGGSKPPEILSSHPDTDNRIKNIQEKIKKDKRKFPALRPRKALIATGPNLNVNWTNGWPNLGATMPDSAQTSGQNQDLLRKGGGLWKSPSHLPDAQLLPQ